MFKAIVRFSIRKKLFVALTTLFLLIGGIWAMLTLPVDAVPDITNNQVQIVTVSPTLAPQGGTADYHACGNRDEQHYERDGDSLRVEIWALARHGGV